MNKKVMILGAGEGQVPFIKICKDRGDKVIAVSIPGDYPGFALSDKNYFIDTRNKEEILRVAVSEKIDAILTDQTDVSVTTVAYVSEKLGLRGIGYNTSLKFTNKYLMREAAEKTGVAVPKFKKVESIEEALSVAEKIGYPVMIKPTDSSGSRGVYKICSPDELEKNFIISKNFSTKGEVIIEQFITGREYLVDGFAMDNKYINLDFGVKEYFDSKNVFVSKMCMFMSASCSHSDIEEKVLNTNKKLVEGMKLKFGITHAEYLYNEADGNVYLVEVAARGGGVFLSSDITPTATGFNSNKVLIDYVVDGKSFDIDNIVLKDNISAWVCFSFPTGNIIDIKGIEATKNICGVYKVDMRDVYIGKQTHVLRDDGDKYGPILIVASSREECYDIIDQVKKTISIKVKTNDSIENLIW